MSRNRIFLFLCATSLLLAAVVRLDWVTGLGGKLERDSASRITGVDLRGTWVTDTELLDLARIPTLVKIDLSHTRISDEGMLHLKPAKQIVDLNLYYAEQITDQGMAAIRDWKNLRHLNLRGTRVSNGTMAIIGTLPQLETLDIANTQVTSVGWDAMGSLTHVKELALSFSSYTGSSGVAKVNDGAFQVLRLLPTLQTLDLGGPKAGGRGKLERAGSALSSGITTVISQLKALKVLKLSYSQIDADGLKILSSMPNLQKLLLSDCPRVDDHAIAALARFPSLKYLDVQETKMTPAGVAALQQAKPGIVILSGGPVQRTAPTVPEGDR